MFRKAKEEPLLDDRIPHPYREVIKELRAIRAELEEIKERLAAAVPPAPPVPPATRERVIEMHERGVSVTEIARELRVSETIIRSIIIVPPAVPTEVYVEALRKYGGLLLADDLYVETIDLGKDRSTSAKIEEFPKLKGIALTIFSNTGTFDLYINEKDDYHKLTFNALTYPQTFLLDWFRARTFYIGNAVQSGKELILIGWKRII